MTFQQKLELIKAAALVAEFWGVEANKLLSFTANFEAPEKKEEWNKIAKEVVAFSKMNISDRAKKLGIKIENVSPDNN